MCKHRAPQGSTGPQGSLGIPRKPYFNLFLKLSFAIFGATHARHHSTARHVTALRVLLHGRLTDGGLVHGPLKPRKTHLGPMWALMGPPGQVLEKE